jgi:hypothetical protein
MLPPREPQFANNRLRFFRLQVGHHDSCAFPTHAEGDRSANSLSAPGYDRNFAFESHGITSPPFTWRVCPVMAALSGVVRK